MGGPAPDSDLAYHGSLILVKDLRAAARGQPAGFEIHQEFDFPGREAIAVECSAQEFGEESPEANELALALLILSAEVTVD